LLLGAAVDARGEIERRRALEAFRRMHRAEDAYDPVLDESDAEWPKSLELVRWGQRAYLVPPNEVVRFCDSVAEGANPRQESDVRVFSREGDERKPVPNGTRPDLCTLLAEVLHR
jgi:hypothetical protein